MGSPCLTPTAELMGLHPLIVSLDGLPYVCNVQQRRLGNSSWMALIKAFLLTELKAFWRSRETRGLCSGQGAKCSELHARRFSALPRMPTPNWTGAKRLQGSSPFDVGVMMAELTIYEKIVPITMGDRSHRPSF